MKTIILTGASDGLGKNFGQLCIKENIHIVGLCRTRPTYPCDYIYTDLTDEDSVLNSCKKIKEKYKHFDALVNCAGIVSLEETDKISYNELQNVFKVNSLAPIFLTSSLLPEIKKNKADVINVVSIMATMFDIEQGSLSYTSSKWALRGASLNLQNELKNSPCRVMTLNIGGMKTNLFKKYNKNLSEITKDWMNPKEIAEILLYFFKLPKQIEVSEIVISRKINYK